MTMNHIQFRAGLSMVEYQRVNRVLGNLKTSLGGACHDLQTAGDAARFRHEGLTEPVHPMTDGGFVKPEAEVSQLVMEAIRMRGHRLELARDDYGGYEAARRDPVNGVLRVATEMRKDGGGGVLRPSETVTAACD